MSAPRTGPRAWQLPPELAALVSSLADDLNAYLDDRRDVFAGRSDKWRDSPEAVQVDGWLDDLAGTAELLSALPTEPEAATP